MTSHVSAPSAGTFNVRGHSSSRIDSQASRALAVQKPYTMRDLAQIALVAASGKRTTASDIMFWISSTFPNKPPGGSWEKGVHACLSRFTEFQGDKRGGIPGERTHYSFSSSTVKESYEEKYAVFCPVDEAGAPAQTEAERVCEGPKGTSDRVHTKSRKRAIKTAERSEQLQSRKQRMEQYASAERLSNTGDRLDDEEDITFNPFERRAPRQYPIMQDYDVVQTRTTSFEEAFAATESTTVESWTEEEKAQKVTEIQARPSRKKYFGQDYKLAHKRRHNLADIHDERQGAWRPARSKSGNDKNTDTSMNMGEDGRQTLRQLFDLPDNMIPMNDGRTELAFRDGTLVNGRLPRPRNVYRVGKMFGGELTVRTF
ncbi:hypothetical protein DE146DRAFT_619569 [Phaeosphaeria sp. MPI-PUGE-AT-0046c]|nr:hypothetical protein DE146DRAFT_619569 [Phaeosphaeria sp. MPI-PUGE-AT-0046c]